MPPRVPPSVQGQALIEMVLWIGVFGALLFAFGALVRENVKRIHELERTYLKKGETSWFAPFPRRITPSASRGKPV